jgi:transcriptional regulator PpsR
VKRFKAPKRSLGALDADAAAAIVAAAADVALVVDGKGIIRDLAFGSEELSRSLEPAGRWLGRAWLDVVTAETRPKVSALLDDAAAAAEPRWRQVNHPAGGEPDVPVLYCALALGDTGRVLALGRDLRAIAALQQRLVDAQQSMERDYWRHRHAETRYRVLFQTTSEPVLIVDTATARVVESNPAADALLARPGKALTGRPFPEGFDEASTQALQSALAAARATGRADDVPLRLAEVPMRLAHDVQARLGDARRELRASIALFRQETASLFLVRFSALDAAASALPAPHAQVLRAVERAPDAFVLTDPDGRIVTANPAFVELTQLPTPEQVLGQSLERWLGRPGVDLNVLLANLRQHRAVRLFGTTMRGEYGAGAEVEINAVAVDNGERACYGFSIRNVGQRLAADARGGHPLPRSVEQLTELVGRVSLKELVREATDVIERLAIEAALELTGDNRASAAEMLGLSRQSLYVKLRRYGLGDLEPDAAGR